MFKKIMDLLTWLADKVLQARDSRTEVRVLVHRAFFLTGSDKRPHYFVKVMNQSPNTEFTITHIWVKDNSKEIDILNSVRPLPTTLSKTRVWETWFPEELIHDTDGVYNNVFIMLSDGKKYKSKKNIDVRPAGYVAQ